MLVILWRVCYGVDTCRAYMQRRWREIALCSLRGAAAAGAMESLSAHVLTIIQTP